MIKKAIYIIIISCCLTVLFGCSSEFTAEKPDTGKIILSLGDILPRTIMPDVDLNDFEKYKFEFIYINNPSYNEVHENIDKTALPFSLDLLPGDINVVITASLEDMEAAKGSLDGITVAAGATSFYTVMLEPISDGSVGLGTFKWDITFENSLDLETAQMTVFLSDNSYNHTIDFLDSAHSGDLRLNPAVYDIYIYLEYNDNGLSQAVEMTEVLHIYSNLESFFEYIFKEDHFNPLSYTVMIFYDHENIQDQTLHCTRNEVVPQDQITANPLKTGYIFDGWFTDSGTFLNGFDLTAPVTSSLVLFAKWRPVTYTVVYNANGGAGNNVFVTHTYDAAQVLRTNAFTRTGYAFSGWNTQAGGTGDNYNENEEVINLTSAQGENITLYAQWEIIQCTVTFHIMGGTGTAPSALPVTRGASITLPGTSSFSRSGYSFTGWQTTADMDKPPLTAGESYTVERSVTFYAQWEPL